jgi:hypothetical protein
MNNYAQNWVRLGSLGLECDPKTIRQGQDELEGEDDLDTERVRKKGVDANG